MFEVIKFIFRLVGQFLSMLFTIDIGPMSLGLFMCIIFIFFPLILAIVGFLKFDIIDEINNKYDNYVPEEKYYEPKHAYKPRHAKRGDR